MILRREIGPKEDGKDLKTVMRHGMKLSAGMVNRLKLTDGIKVNGNAVFTNFICSTGDLVTLDISTVEPELSIVPEDRDITILYEDEFYIAAYKPPDVLTHPSRKQFTGTLISQVAGYLSKSGPPTCHVVNRLDRHTSGIVLFAKNSYAKALSTAFMKEATKEYLAVVCGKPEKTTGTIDLPIRRSEKWSMFRLVAPDGERSITHYELVKSFEYGGYGLSLVRLRLETGRTHQIRVHCTAIGCPILGDLLYFNHISKEISDRYKLAGQLLHAGRLSFIHPISSDLVDIYCPIIREDMGAFVANNYLGGRL